MKKVIVVIISLITLILLVIFFLPKYSNIIYYESKESAVSSLFLEQSFVLESIPVSNNKEVIFFYDHLDKALFIATIGTVENNTNYFIENKTNAWKIDGEFINGEYYVDDRIIQFYAWKGSDKLNDLINGNKIIKQNQSKIKSYMDNVNLLLLIDK